MSSNVMKVVRVTEDVHQRLANLGKIGDTYNDVIERLLNEYEEYMDIIEAEEEIEKGLVKTYSNQCFICTSADCCQYSFFQIGTINNRRHASRIET